MGFCYKLRFKYLSIRIFVVLLRYGVLFACVYPALGVRVTCSHFVTLFRRTVALRDSALYRFWLLARFGAGLFLRFSSVEAKSLLGFGCSQVHLFAAWSFKSEGIPQIESSNVPSAMKFFDTSSSFTSTHKC